MHPPPDPADSFASRPVTRTRALAIVLIVLALLWGLLSYVVVQGQSAVRAYVASESHWSKAQRDAAFSLYRYGVTGDRSYLRRFHEGLKVPLGDRAGRLEALKPDYDRAVVDRGFLAGKAHPADLDLLVWGLRCCAWHPDMQTIIGHWEAGEQQILRLQELAGQLEAEMHAESPSVIRFSEMLDEIERISDASRPIQEAFTTALGDLARKVSKLLIVLSVAVGLMLVFVGTHVIRRGLRSIRESDAQYRILLQSAGTGFVVIDPDGERILEANREAESMVQQPARALIGQPFARLFVGGTPPASGEPGQTCRLIGANGLGTEVEVSLRPTYWYGRPARLAVLHDVSARLRVQRALRVANDAIANMAEAVVITDHRFVFTSVNRAFTAITGFEPAEVIGRRHSTLAGDAFPGQVRQILRALGSSGRWQGELSGRRRDGEAFPRMLSLAAVRDDDERLTHFVCIFTDHSAFRDYERRLRALAERDALTGLLNRASFADRGTELVGQAASRQLEVAMLYVDLDGFKFINDTYGHGAGDEVLRVVSDRIGAIVGPTALVARIGGDEFNVLLEQARGSDDSRSLAREMLAALAEPISWEGRQLALSASIGLAHAPRDACELASLAACADIAMYQAKARGRNTFQLFERHSALPVGIRHQLADDLRGALDKAQFQLHYQPQFELASGRIVGFEALLRWNHPQLGWVPPALFIPITEELGVIDVVSDWVLRAACQQACAWRDQGLGEPMMSANLSPRSFWDRQLPDRVRAIVEEAGWSTQRLCLEITEGTLMAGDDPKGALRRFRDLGVRMAIDDFGVGYSSLTNLRRVPLDVLKIDRSFIAGIPADGHNLALIGSILTMAQSLGLTVIAEGVETVAQRTVLEREGCPQAQGYLFGRPAPAADCARLLSAARLEPSSAPLA